MNILVDSGKWILTHDCLSIQAAVLFRGKKLLALCRTLETLSLSHINVRVKTNIIFVILNEIN